MARGRTHLHSHRWMDETDYPSALASTRLLATTMRNRTPRAALIVWLPGILLASMATPVVLDAQAFTRGNPPPDVNVVILERPYTLRGDSPAEFMSALRLLGLGGVGARLSVFNDWQYEAERLPLALLRAPSNLCRPTRMRLNLRLTAEYPVWEPTSEAAPLLLEAWGAFQEVLAASWEEKRDAAYRELEELTRLGLRLEADCTQLRAELVRLSDRVRAQSEDAWNAAIERGELVRLQWPPPGFEPRFATAGMPSIGTSEVRMPQTDRELLRERAELDVSQGSREGLTVVAGLYHEDQVQYVQQLVGPPLPDGVAARDGTPQEFLGLTEVLVSTLAGGLDSAGVVDLAVPISTYMPELDARVGRVTLEQLLSHRAGIDNAQPDTANGLSWAGVVRAMPARRVFTEPGVIYSYSGYSYPLAIHVLETITLRPLAELMSAALFTPLGMSNTTIGGEFRGLPSTMTTPFDVMRLLTAWVRGGLRGSPPLIYEADPINPPDVGGRSFARGVWYDQVAGIPRVSLICDGAAFQVLPVTSTALMLMSSGRWPTDVWRFLSAEMGDLVSVGSAFLRPLTPAGAAELGAVEPTCPEPYGLKEQVTELGERAASGSWPGLYVNGDMATRLGDQGGFLQETNAGALDVYHWTEDVYFVGTNGRPFYPLQLKNDAAGRRYLVLDGRAYIHEDDRP